MKFRAPEGTEYTPIRLFGKFLGRVKGGVLDTTSDYNPEKHLDWLLAQGFEPLEVIDGAKPAQSTDDDPGTDPRVSVPGTDDP